MWCHYNAQLPQAQCTVFSFYATQSKGGHPTKPMSPKGTNYWRWSDQFDYLASDSLPVSTRFRNLIGMSETPSPSPSSSSEILEDIYFGKTLAESAVKPKKSSAPAVYFSFRGPRLWRCK